MTGYIKKKQKIGRHLKYKNVCTVKFTDQEYLNLVNRADERDESISFIIREALEHIITPINQARTRSEALFIWNNLDALTCKAQRDFKTFERKLLESSSEGG